MNLCWFIVNNFNVSERIFFFRPNVGNLPPVYQRIIARAQAGNQQVPPLPPRPHSKSNHMSYGGPMYGGYGMYGYGMPYGGGFGLRGGDYDSR